MTVATLRPDAVVKNPDGGLLVVPDRTRGFSPDTNPAPGIENAQLDAVEMAEERAAEAAANEADLLPEFPKFTGSLADLSAALSPDIPREFKTMAAVTFWGLIRSGSVTFADEPHLQPRFYTVFIAEPWRGKTAAINEVRRAMATVSTNFSALSSIDSGPALIDAFEEQTEKTMIAGSSGSRLLLDPDELKDLFEKAKVSPGSRNSLFTEFLKLFESNRTGNRSRKNGNVQIDNAHLGIIGGATTEGYPMMWTGSGGGSSGLQSRFTLIGTNSSKMPARQRPADSQALTAVTDRLKTQTQRIPHLVRFEPRVEGALDEWWTAKPRDKAAEGRIPDIVKRLLLVLAETNDTDTIDQNLMDQAIAFGDYEIHVREKFNPADSHSWTQSFENQIIDVFRRRGVPITENVVRRFVRPDRKPGGFGPFLQAWKNLVAAGVVWKCAASQRAPKYILR